MTDGRTLKITGEKNMKEFNSFDNYLKSLEKFEFLTAEEEKELIKKAQAGDRKASARIIQANLRFVVDQAKKMLRKGCKADIEDLISAGNMGLVKAVSKFKLEKNVRFITCAAFWIRAEMNAEAGMTHAIRLPHNCQVLLSKIRLVEANLPEGLGQSERYEYIAKKVGATKAGVKAILEATSSVSSLDALISDEDDSSFYDFCSDASAVDPLDEVVSADMNRNFKKVMNSLPEDERRVLESHYGLGTGKALSLDEIARNWGKEITREGIRQKEIKAMKRFRETENRCLFDGMFGEAV
ncbi:RNA polymerase sigma factor RpoD/SigA [Treponema sp.]|uniref:sigma-70 family RNA polymerase sigma factor n=1 Tax=Treponema sp. TaxID=166 RepID=UPI00298EBC73|nr:RNA polymerase sigma factor RpoD/SigA [Treponema sp.]MCQ2241541.1 RNA polymerase sigma factor RpoD/SigA [Treponema sp.]